VTVIASRPLALSILCLCLLAVRPRAAYGAEDGEESLLTPHVRLSVGAGYDSNVRLAPLLDQAGVSAETPRSGTYAALSLFAGLTIPLGAASTEVEYGLLQTAYTDRRLDGSSFQMHLGEWAWEIPLADTVHLRLPVQGDVSLLGLVGGPRPFEWSIGGEPALAIRLARGLKLRAAGGFSDHHPLDPAYPFLEGAERHLLVSMAFGTTAWTGTISAKLRSELFGATRVPTPTTGAGCPSCAAAVVTPYSYQGRSLATRIAAPFSWRLRPVLSASVEDLQYEVRMAETTYADGSSLRVPLPARRDVKVAVRAALAWTLTAAWQLVLRYDFVQNGSNLPAGADTTCDGLPTCLSLTERDHAYRKHALGLALECDWL
jgi:hypothetical protein